VREALFSSLESMLGGWTGLRVLDAYAGSGAVGLEALSRGAAEVTFVERDRRAATLLRRNIDAVGLPGARVLVADAATADPTGPFDLAFLDPPYDVPDRDVAAVLERWATPSVLDQEALVIVEREVRSGAPWPESGWDSLRRREYGETALWYGRLAL
jgi:16S rRNA (guanine966-N2)-methyltransferase